MPIDYATLGPASGKLDVQRKNNFLINIGNGTDGWAAGLQLYVKSFPFPEIKNNNKTVRTGNLVTNYAGALAEISAVNMVCREYLDRKTSKTWMAWRDRVVNVKTGHIGLTSAYKVDGKLHKLPPGNASMTGVIDGTYQQTWDLVGIYPSSYKEDDYDQSDDGAEVLVTIGLVIDFVIPSGVTTAAWAGVKTT